MKNMNGDDCTHSLQARLTGMAARWRPWVPVGVMAALVGYFALAAMLRPLPVLADGPCGKPAVAIQSIQGTQAASSRQGEWLVTEGIVTADFTGSGEFGGFFFQQADHEGPEKSGASRAVFVYAPDAEVEEGTRLRLRGQVGEYYGMTQLSQITIKARCGAGLVEPVPVSLPLTDRERQQLQAMRIRLEPPLTVVGTYPLGRFGTLKLADERLYIPTQLASPGREARTVAESNRNRMLLLDDGSRRQNPDPIPYPPPELTANNSLRVGDQVEAIEGVLDFRYGDWRVQPVVTPRFVRANPRPDPPPAPAPQELRLAGFNVENYFNGEGGFPTPRGAANPRELERQEAKLFAALKALNASVIGLVEVANDGYGEQSSVATLARSLGRQWRWVAPEGERLGRDEISVGLIYDARRVEPLGAAHTLEGAPFRTLNRQPLAQRFRDRASDLTFMVVVNHLKSKRCHGAEGENADQGDGQGCWNHKRTRATYSLVTWLEDLREETGEERILLLGDLNAYAREDPLKVLKATGYHNLLGTEAGAQPSYSYVFRGQSGTLDYALASAAMGAVVEDARTWPINADEPVVLDYTLEGKSRRLRELLFSPEPWRSSDHDPVLVTLK